MHVTYIQFSDPTDFVFRSGYESATVSEVLEAGRSIDTAVRENGLKTHISTWDGPSVWKRAKRMAALDSHERELSNGIRYMGIGRGTKKLRSGGRVRFLRKIF